MKNVNSSPGGNGCKCLKGDLHEANDGNDLYYRKDKFGFTIAFYTKHIDDDDEYEKR